MAEENHKAGERALKLTVKSIILCVATEAVIRILVYSYKLQKAGTYAVSGGDIMSYLYCALVSLSRPSET